MGDSNDYENLLKFIISREEHIVIELLRDPPACRTFLRLLKPLSQHLLFRLLMIPGPVPLALIREWAPTGKESYLSEAFSELRECHFLDITMLQDVTRVQLHPDIRHALLSTGGDEMSFDYDRSDKTESKFSLDVKTSSIFPEKPKVELTNLNEIPEVSADVLDEYSSSQLDKILYWMLKLSDKIDEEMKQLLRDSELINMENELTRKGHQFVLEDRKSQIWQIVSSYLNSFLQDTSSDLIAALRFLLKLGSLQFTRGYPIKSLKGPQTRLLSPFSSLGLVYLGTKDKKGFFFPTRVVLNFFGKEQITKSEGWLLIDTNFKITAYTSSPLHVALLKKFTLITYEMPGFTSAYLSPNSFKKALKEGTTLDDILKFLKSNISSKGDGKIPPDVEHQLLVWKNQRDRIRTTPDCVLRTYLDRQEYEVARAIADDLMGVIKEFVRDDRYYLITKEEIEDEYAQRLKEYRYQ